jgi:hypothetical protein
LPPVHDVADQIERFAIDRFEEVEQQLGVAPRGPEMGVGNPYRAHSEQRPAHLEMVRLLDPARGPGKQGFGGLPATARLRALRQVPGRSLPAPVGVRSGHEALSAAA